MHCDSTSCDTVATTACDQRIGCDTVATQPCPFERRSLVDELAAKGIRLTSQRKTIIEIIQSADEHLDAASLLQKAKEKESGIDRATIYRTIDLLKKHRLIDELDLLRGEKHYYEVKTRREHVHLACFQCGQVDEFASTLLERLKQEISRQSGFEVRVSRLELGGRCRSCSQAAGETIPNLLPVLNY